jgi:hypothetical protein
MPLCIIEALIEGPLECINSQYVDNRCSRSESVDVTMKCYILDGCYYSSCPHPAGFFFAHGLTIPEPVPTLKKRQPDRPRLIAPDISTLCPLPVRAFFYSLTLHATTARPSTSTRVTLIGAVEVTCTPT